MRNSIALGSKLSSEETSDDRDVKEIRETALSMRKLFKIDYVNPQNLIHASDGENAAL